MSDIRKPLLGMSLYELKEVAKTLGLPAFAGGQIAKWIYTQHVKSIDDMTNISKAGREKLKDGFFDRDGCFYTENGSFFVIPLHV